MHGDLSVGNIPGMSGKQEMTSIHVYPHRAPVAQGRRRTLSSVLAQCPVKKATYEVYSQTHTGAKRCGGRSLLRVDKDTKFLFKEFQRLHLI